VSRTPFAALALFLCLGVVEVSARQAPPTVRETVVVTGGALPVAFRELPRTVRVVTRDDIERLPVSSVMDMIRLVASVDLRARAPRGMQVDFGARGSTFGQVLVLIDGARLNNAQTGHHNGDLPVTLDEIERVEVLLGPGSSAFGADAFGGTINIITRRGGPARLSAVVGEHGLVDAGVSAGWRAGAVHQAVAGGVSRSSGFRYDRDFSTLTFSSNTRLGARTRVSAGLVDKAFGASDFYGPSPSKEWTRLWTAAVEHAVERGTIKVTTRSSYRAHRDRFVWDVTRPGLSANTHRTYALDGAVHVRWRASAATEVGALAEGAADWIRSSNLGNHAQGRGAAALDVQHRFGNATTLQSAVRIDGYSTFGIAGSPSLGLSHWLAPAWRVRGSGGKAFRVPTFTERYYRDPAHAADPALAPERAWAVDAAVDWLPSPVWQGSAGLFRRWERGVIDWVRPDASTVWHTTNIRKVNVSGLEASVRRSMGRQAMVTIDYTWLTVDAAQLRLESKYTLDYARHSLVMSGSARGPGSIDAGFRLEGRDRIGRAPYVLVDLRVSRRTGKATFFVDAANLFGVAYQEISGVPMPGRWLTAGVRLSR
jgi:iron complex outermembrane receptor protein